MISPGQAVHDRRQRIRHTHHHQQQHLSERHCSWSSASQSVYISLIFTTGKLIAICRCGLQEDHVWAGNGWLLKKSHTAANFKKKRSREEVWKNRTYKSICKTPDGLRSNEWYRVRGTRFPRPSSCQVKYREAPRPLHPKRTCATLWWHMTSSMALPSRICHFPESHSHFHLRLSWKLQEGTAEASSCWF